MLFRSMYPSHRHYRASKSSRTRVRRPSHRRAGSRSGSVCRCRAETEAAAEAARRSAPLARLRAQGGVLQETAVESVVEADTLETDTGDLECARGVELVRLVDVLWRGVLARCESFLDQGL